MADYGSASDGELQAAQAAIRAEVQRREELSQAEHQARFRQELAEVRAGQRTAYDEHVRALSPAETLALAESGGLSHLGVGKSKRRGQR